MGWAGTVDIYLAMRGHDGWSEPEPLRELNTEGADFGVASSPDGRWLYYKNGSSFMRVDMESVLGPYRQRHGGRRIMLEPDPSTRGPSARPVRAP